MTSDLWSAEAWLVDAGLLDAVEAAERRTVHHRRDTRLSFRPGTTDIAYEDGSGEPPCAADLVVHLDLLRHAADVHAAAMVAHGDELAGGNWLPADEPPVWVLGLFLPAGLVALAAGDRWMPAFTLLPLALVAPTLWRAWNRRRKAVTAPV